MIGLKHSMFSLKEAHGNQRFSRRVKNTHVNETRNKYKHQYGTSLF